MSPQPSTATKVEQVCRYIESTDTLPSLKELAAQVGLNPWQLHRQFVRETGLTPRAYAAGLRARRLRAGLETDGSVTDAIYQSGFNSSSRYYEAAEKLLGMPTRDYRAGAPNTSIRFAIGQCSLGAILVAESPKGICAILLGDDPDELARTIQDRFPKAELIGGDPEFERRIATVVGFVDAPSLGLQLPLDIRGTVFQERVWQALLTIPPGSTVSYAELAECIGAPTATRAVARACGANLLAVAIPCHRVVRRDGALGGYRWGVDRKQRLLDAERA